MMIRAVTLAGALVLAACGSEPPPPPAPVEPDTDAAPATAQANADALELHVFDCGTIEVADLDAFSTAGDYAGESDTFANTCWLVRHPEGDLLWDTGLPGMLAGSDPQENGIFTVSLDQTLSEQMRTRGIDPAGIEYVSVSHSHFDHIGQIDQFDEALWLVHADELAAMFPPEDQEGAAETATQFAAFAPMTRREFTGEKDVFGDGSVVILPTPGHTPGHTALIVTLPETGPVMLSGDLWHRAESRELSRVPVFNTDEAETLASMEAFETRADRLDAKVIIQHEAADIAPLPDVLK